jgi:two-component system LytT family sensor kinase
MEKIMSDAGLEESSLLQKSLLFHLLFWAMYIVALTLEMQGMIAKMGLLFFLLAMAIYCLLTAVLVYANTILLIPFLLERKKKGLYVIAILFIAIGYTLARSRLQVFWYSEMTHAEDIPVSAYFKWNLFYAFWFLLISILLSVSQKWSEHKQQVKNSQISHLQTELKYLRSQMNPHFLFNGLNTIYSQIDMSNTQARNIMVQFSDLLRYNLYEADVDSIELGTEIKYLQNYVDLQRARSNENMNIELEIHIENGSLKIAPLLFMAFVENAFKFSTRDENINIIQIKLTEKNKTVSFECRNGYEEEPPAARGIGLQNTIRRLDLLYKNRYELTMKNERGLYYVHLIVRL